MSPAPGMYELELPYQMIKPKSSHTATFGKSKADRFATRDNPVPGPGAYAVNSNFSSSDTLLKQPIFPKGLVHPSSLVPELQKDDAAEEGKKIHWARKFVPPSIPSGAFKIGYDVSDNGNLKLRKSLEEVRRQVMEKSPIKGFAEEGKLYDKGTSFSKSKSSRDHLFRTDSVPGPGNNIS